MIIDFLSDFRMAVRSLLTTPAFATVTVLTLAMAVGATTAIVSVIDGVLFQPLPYPDADRLVWVSARTVPEAALTVTRIPFSDRGYWHFVKNNRAFERFGGIQLYTGADQSAEWALTGQGQPLSVNVARMTASAFEVLGLKPQRGRLPTAGEDVPGGPQLVLVSDALWRGVFGADPSIVDRTIELNGSRWEVIGVMPARYDFPSAKTDVWVPYQLDPASGNFGSLSIGGIARLKPGVTIEAALADAESLIARFKEIGYPDSWFKNFFSGKASIRTLKEDIVGDSRRPLFVLLATMSVVLLIACSNVANLFLKRRESRVRDAAVRMALGSGRRRLVQFVFMEGLLLSSLGGITGVLLAFLGVRILVRIGPASIPRLDQVSINLTVLIFTFGISVLTGLLFSLLPAIRTGSPRVLKALCSSGRSGRMGRERHPAHNLLIVTQVAMALALFVGAALMVRSFAALRSANPGINPAGILTFRLSPPLSKYPTPETVTRFYDELLDKLRVLPGVSGAGAITFLPVAGLGTDLLLTTRIEEFPPVQGDQPPLSLFRRAAPGYFETMGIPLIEGRTFTADDHQRRLGTLIISKSIKDKYWPHTSALGKNITIQGAAGSVVGVVGDVHDTRLDVPAERIVYKPLLDKTGGRPRAMALAVRVRVEPLSILGEVRRVIGSMDPDLPIMDVHTMPSIVGDSFSRTSFTMVLLALAAAIALFLGAVGIYGVIAYDVSQRTGEIGLRMALGADPGTVQRLILSEAICICLIGIGLGLAAALGLGRFLSSLLYGVSPYDVASLFTSSLVFLVVAALASALPAARAARVAPAEAVRTD